MRARRIILPAAAGGCVLRAVCRGELMGDGSE